MQNLPNSRSAAKKSGSKYYFTGKECLRGHVSHRWASTGKCFQCARERLPLEWQRRKNCEKHMSYMREYSKQYVHKNRRKCKRKTYAKNRDKILSAAKKYRSRNRGLYVMLCQQRRDRVAIATPKWLTVEDSKAIESIYKECGELNKIRKNSHHVDHIIPIRGDNVCGLHVPSNLQVISASENTRKSNTWIIS